MPDHVINAFICAEDRNFFAHRGINIFSISRAYLANLKSGTITQGASTITQQLVRLLFLNHNRTYDRKLREAILALALEAKLEKKMILEMYLNQIYLGGGAFGVEAASQRYFNKSVVQLSLGEAAMLAGLPKAPSRLAPHRNYSGAKERQIYVLKQMLKSNKITTKDYNHWRKTEITVRKNPLNSSAHSGYFVSEANKELHRKVNLRNTEVGVYRIQTTMNSELQKQLATKVEAITKGINQKLTTKPKALGQIESAFVVIDSDTGAILALQGGQNFHKTQFNRAVNMKREISALFIPILYSVALDRGFTLFDNTKGRRGNGVHFLRRDNPDISLYDSFMRLDTLGSVNLLVELGLPDVIGRMHDLGLKTNPRDLRLALGRSALLGVARAFAAVFSKFC